MKRFLLITVALLFCRGIQAQIIKVEDNLTGVQAGLFGIWGHYERMLSLSTASRLEAGLDNALIEDYNGLNFYLVPVFVVEPRWYYNLKKRASRGKKHFSNSANYISLFVRHHPGWFIISNYYTIAPARLPYL